MGQPPRRSSLTSIVAATLVVAALAYVAWSERQAPVADRGPVPAPASRPAGTAEAPRTQEPASRPAPASPSESPATTKVPRSDEPPRASRDDRARGPVMRDQRIHDEQGRLVYEGDVDLGPVFARIAAGEHDSHRNDGSTFGNREGRLPRQPRGYYTEWVVRTEGVRSVGPQRLITGRHGEAYYTPDHYETFVPVRPPS